MAQFPVRGRVACSFVLIVKENEAHITNTSLRKRLTWVKSIATPETKMKIPVPFTAEELPEAIAALMAMGDINRFGHVVMDGSPVNAPMGLQGAKAAVLRLFGGQLRATHVKPLTPGRALPLLPPAPLPTDMRWGRPKSPHRGCPCTVGGSR